MAYKLFHVDIVSPDKSIYNGAIQSLVVPCELGYLGVLAGHAPFIANIVRGKITLKEDSGETLEISCKGRGFLEVIKNNATLLLDSG